MKKIYLLLALFLGGSQVYSQSAFNPTWMNLDPETTFTPDFDQNPYNKKIYRVAQLPFDWDYNSITNENEFDDLWNQIYGDSMLVSNLIRTQGEDPFDLSSPDPSYGSVWKAVYDKDNLYVFIKSWDRDNISLGEKHFEVSAQTHPLIDMATGRYEADFQAASNNLDQNESYARYIELGGGRAHFKGGEVYDYTAFKGSEGAWAQNEVGFAGLNNTKHFWQQNSQGILRAILVMPFNSALSYPVDPYGDLNNTIAFDPLSTAHEDSIVFEICESYPNIDDEWISYAWSSNNTLVYGLNYYAGILIFSHSPPKVPNSTYNYCVNENPVPLQAEGINLKWYTELNGPYTEVAPVPSTLETGTSSYFVTQTIDGFETKPAVITVEVYDYELLTKDKTIKCGESVSFIASTNYRGEGSENFSWTGDYGLFSQKEIGLNPENSGVLNLTVTTNTGCSVSKDIALVIEPSLSSAELISVSSDPVTNKNIIKWKIEPVNEIDSVLILSGIQGSASVFDTIARIAYSDHKNSIIDERNHSIQTSSTYEIRLKDKCGFITQPFSQSDVHRGVNLAGSRINQNSNVLQWNNYEGRNVLKYEVLRGENDIPSIPVHTTANDQSFYDITSFNDTVFYRVKTYFNDDHGASDLKYSYSNTIMITPYENIYTDTVTVTDTIVTEIFDTTYIEEYKIISVTDTLIINAVLTGPDHKRTLNTLKVYPNPAKDHIIIETGNFDFMNGYRVRIINQIGVVMFERGIERARYELNLSDWTGKGLYFLQLIDLQGNIIDIRKIVLQ